MLVYQGIITVILISLLLIAVWNIAILRRVKTYSLHEAELPFVSVLVPLRNEESNAERCLRSLLLQDYPNYELIVLNDNSEDRTPEILEKLKKKYPSLKVLQGRPLPEGWTGKTYACKQMADQAKGEWLLFTDADTRHYPNSIKLAIETAISKDADLLTLFPGTIMKTLPEKIIMPMLFFTVFTLLPLYFVSKKGYTRFSMGMGPYMLFKRQAYDKIGGHGEVKHALVEDVWLARKIKERGLRLIIADGKEMAEIRMYSNFREIWNGFSKNIFAGFNFSAPMLFAVNIAFFGLFFLPFVFWFVNLFYFSDFNQIILLLTVQVVVLYLIKTLLAFRFNLGILSTVLHPLGALLIPIIAVNSWRWIASGRGARWKDRTYTIQTLKIR
jgi:chlorobactene glucosyltransferase